MFDFGSILLILGLLLLVGLYVGRPFMERGSLAVSEEEHQFSALMAERDRILDALQELDFDHQLGKIPAQEYPAQRARLLELGAEVLRQLDSHKLSPSLGNPKDRIEAAIAARRAEAGPEDRRVAALQPDDELEALIASRRRARAEKAVGFCPQCGQPTVQSDKFCARCGAPID
jgi:NADH pyrophosphatase NudC (nudix superfamily)